MDEDQSQKPEAANSSSEGGELKSKDSYLKRLWNEGPDRHIELVLAFMIAVFAGVQLFTTLRNNSSTSEQTAQLITAAKISAYAAKQNAGAASDFAASARSINQGMDKAVNELNSQANAIEAARATATESAHLDQRPWLGFRSIQCSECNLVFDPQKLQNFGTTVFIGTFGGNLVNSGKTPAEQVHLQFTITRGTKATPLTWKTDYERLHPYDPTLIVSAGQADAGPRYQPAPLIGPGVEVPIFFVGGGKNYSGRSGFGVPLGMKKRVPVVFVQGKITYKDEWGGGHETDFCIFVSPPGDVAGTADGGDSYAYCDAPNSNAMH